MPTKYFNTDFWHTLHWQSFSLNLPVSALTQSFPCHYRLKKYLQRENRSKIFFVGGKLEYEVDRVLLRDDGLMKQVYILKTGTVKIYAKIIHHIENSNESR